MQSDARCMTTGAVVELATGREVCRWDDRASHPYLTPSPDGTGLIIADGYDAEILRLGPQTALAGARRKGIVQNFARHAALRLQAYRDPGVRATGISVS